ncbi:hypothetical protein diail_11552 [Diaporthe ilicicola]|nr:hypothetical protein diail_11552 [Diaporthe ilicicola]
MIVQNKSSVAITMLSVQAIPTSTDPRDSFDSQLTDGLVLFKFRPDVSQQHKDSFVAELKKLKSLPCVHDAQLTVGGPSVTDPIERSKGYEFALVSRHKDKAALAEYQASSEHRDERHSVTSKLLWPFQEDVCRFDFETSDEDSSKSLI